MKMKKRKEENSKTFEKKWPEHHQENYNGEDVEQEAL